MEQDKDKTEVNDDVSTGEEKSGVIPSVVEESPKTESVKQEEPTTEGTHSTAAQSASAQGDTVGEEKSGVIPSVVEESPKTESVKQEEPTTEGTHSTAAQSASAQGDTVGDNNSAGASRDAERRSRGILRHAATPTACAVGVAAAQDDGVKENAEGAAQDDGEKEKAKHKTSIANIIAMVVSGILIVIIVPLLAVTVVLSVRAAINPDMPPSIFGYAPLTVASGSMSGSNADSFDEGDLIFIKILSDDEKNQLQVNDIICYTTDGVFVTHRIISITEEDGVITSLITMGDANYSADDPITTADIYGKYSGCIKNLGDFAEFLQTPAGIALFIAVPIVAFIVYDVTMTVLRKRKSEESSKDEEIARLKKMLDEKNNSEKGGDE